MSFQVTVVGVFTTTFRPKVPSSRLLIQASPVPRVVLPTMNSADCLSLVSTPFAMVSDEGGSPMKLGDSAEPAM